MTCFVILKAKQFVTCQSFGSPDTMHVKAVFIDRSRNAKSLCITVEYQTFDGRYS